MAARLKVQLLPNWRDCTLDDPSGPPTYRRINSVAPGPLQISWAWYKSCQLPNRNDDVLISLSRGTFARLEGVKLLSTDSGPCAFGRFGTAVSTSVKYPRLQSWYLSDGPNFVMVTHMCPTEPDPDEIVEAARIVSLMAVREEA